jgi:hypothetical protein
MQVQDCLGAKFVAQTILDIVAKEVNKAVAPGNEPGVKIV